MQKSGNNHLTKINRRQVGASTTLNRRYVKRPARILGQNSMDGISRPTKAPTATKIPVNKISHFGSQVEKKASLNKETIQPAKPHPAQILANQKVRERKQIPITTSQTHPTAKELKEQAIKKALLAAAKQEDIDNQSKAKKIHFGFGRICLALSCAAAAIFAIVYFVNLNMPDIQFRAAAAQFDATYPNYLPYNYSPTGIVSENGVTTLSFENYTSKESFTISEEKSAWDSNSLLNNFVKNEYGEDYATVREQGLTIYVGNNKASWVNGGIVYKITILKGSLSKKQISSIATSF